jgi:hypothetical protein
MDIRFFEKPILNSPYEYEWTSQVRSDGADYDIASFNRDGSPRGIEVKPTGLGASRW